MIKSFAALMLLISCPLFAQTIYLANLNGEKFLKSESSPFNLSGNIDLGAIGLCSAGECSRKFNMSEAFLHNLARSNGVLEIPDFLKDQ